MAPKRGEGKGNAPKARAGTLVGAEGARWHPGETLAKKWHPKNVAQTWGGTYGVRYTRTQRWFGVRISHLIRHGEFEVSFRITYSG